MKTLSLLQKYKNQQMYKQPIAAIGNVYLKSLILTDILLVVSTLATSSPFLTTYLQHKPAILIVPSHEGNRNGQFLFSFHEHRNQ